MKKKLEGILKQNESLSDEQCQLLLRDICENYEKENEKAFMEGYQYAISMLKDGIVKKHTLFRTYDTETE